jgi:hypothetical protein
MRIIWISVFLFLAVTLLTVVLHEPGENPIQHLSRQKAPDAANPFIEDEGHNKQVELAALPADQQPEQSLSEPTPQTQVDSALPVEAQSHVEDNARQAELASTESVADTPADVAETEVNANDGNAAAAESAAQQKPLGLLARSLEQTKNQNKIAVIVHVENNQELTVNEIRAMYQDRITRWQDGSKIMLYNLPLGDSHREKFSRDILDMTALEADEAESKRRENNLAINSVRVKNKNIVVSYVEREPNAIAYVPLSMIRDKSNVKVVATLP